MTEPRRPVLATAAAAGAAAFAFAFLRPGTAIRRLPTGPPGLLARRRVLLVVVLLI